ncbi:Fe2+-dependent dioxygenase [Acidovorax sp. SUPP2522]|uniref:Fe2+-dependent dioxygenase n=1 Tax=unclassified Acidovorax TaxID=2684926 RepID=UPI00234A38A3|nr:MULTISPECIES: Fe2+-dependent dioxygenase [unclassified Acidovorax]WCM97007.1 Fe2+-dependent dioxygenase [Acidovorax sp. GBBC 1281]GKT15148.1 Fe2+-dependent dioxygenase [Acidovorax sp. SUPP2522]
MLITLEHVLDPDEVRHFRQRLDGADWRSGSATAGTLARSVKRNEQLDDASEVAVELGQHLLRVLGRHPTFIAAALPRRIHPPKFNRYADGGTYGAHVDSAVMQWPGTQQSMRTDVSATLFLADPHEYDGGELEIEGPFGVQGVKLEAGDLVLYPSSSLHRVTPVTRGARIASFFWIESLVQDEGDRTLLFDLDQTIQRLTPSLDAADPRLLQLTGVYHNLLRRWAQT